MLESFEKCTINGMEFDVIPLPHSYLRRKREEKNLTQQQVADSSGIALRQYQRYESGERSFSQASFRIGIRICKALDINPLDLEC